MALNIKMKKTSKTGASVKRPKPAARPTGPDWRAEDDARVLMAAEEIKKDAARLRKAKAAAQQKAAALQKVTRL